MPLIPPVINSAMDAAFVAGMKAMAAYSTGAEGTQDNSKDAIIAAFAGVAGPAITAYIKSATVLPGITVATAGSPAAQTGATTGPGVIA